VSWGLAVERGVAPGLGGVESPRNREWVPLRDHQKTPMRRGGDWQSCITGRFIAYSPLLGGAVARALNAT
jgi:hypothetical protein